MLHESLGVNAVRLREAINSGQCSCGCDLVEGAIAVRATAPCYAIKIPVTARYKYARGSVSIRPTERVQYRVPDVRGNLEDYPRVVSRVGDRTVEIAVGTHCQPSRRLGFLLAGKLMQNR